MRLSRSIVGKQESEAVAGVLEQSGYLGMGEEVRLFEEEIAAYLGVPPWAVSCVNSGTAALHLAMECSLPEGAEVLIPSLTFVASFQAALQANLRPVACDVQLKNGLLDLADAETRITPETRAVMPVHYASNPTLCGEIYDFAEKHNLRVIEDAAHAFGCTFKGKKIGSFGDIVCFSFDGIKNITSGEGGAVVTLNPELARLIKDARLLSVENDTEKRFQGKRSWNPDVKRRGWRYHMSNIMAAIGRTQLSRLENEFAPARRELARLYRQRLSNVPGVQLLEMNMEEVIPHIHPVRILDGRLEAVRNFLEQAGIPTGSHYKPNHLLSLFGGGGLRLPASEQLIAELLTLPLHPGLKLEDADFICSKLIEALTAAAQAG
ncbi:MAG: DegT/DnrJ/EryC1/StrS family aminotransferase [Desulfovibrionaceae bacterium]|nr:DegT/DnrJ/EryC1/StrS family aminotransferase [Desulfovibrionaceae bacterium]